LPIIALLIQDRAAMDLDERLVACVERDPRNPEFSSTMLAFSCLDGAPEAQRHLRTALSAEPRPGETRPAGVSQAYAETCATQFSRL
jgi:hypothetical protein